MGKLPFLLIVVCSWIFQPILLAQEESQIKAILSEGDLKKLEKADASKKQADLLTEEASKLNMEVFTIQVDMNLEDKARARKMKQLESKALQNQIEASALYEKCNEIKYTLYKQYIDAFWKEHENQEADYLNAKLLEEQSTDHYFQAISYRIEAKKMDGYAKVERLTEAQTLENQAIQKQVTALTQYHGITPASEELTTPVVPAEESVSEPEDELSSQPEAEPAEQAISGSDTQITSVVPSKSEFQQGDIRINQQMIDSYNRYIETGQFNDTALSTGAIAGVTGYDSDKLLDLWYEYIYGRDDKFSEVNDADTPEIEDDVTGKDDLVTITKVSESAGEKEIGIVTDENVGKLIPADENVVYRVQIAANKTELTQRALSRMYYGNKNVEMINENGWFKYSVGDFETYDEASQFRKSSGISNAFVVAYRKGTSVTPVTNDPLVHEQAALPVLTSNRLPGGLIFRIQVSASRVPLTVAQLGKIYSGTYPVEMVFEEGWYKYQLMGVRLYSDALQIIKNIHTPGVFVVAYEEGLKTELAASYNKNKALEQDVRNSGRKIISDPIEFHVQLAASKTAMTKNEMSLLFSEPEKLSVIFENGWYKYHIKAGNSAAEAEQIKASCGKPNAFIVAYKMAATISFYEALKEIR